MAKIIGTTPNRMASKRGKLGLKPNKGKRDTYKLTEEEISVLCGTLLGDSTIRYVHNQCKYPNLTFSHTVKQKQYFMWKTNKLTNLMSSSNMYKTNYVNTNGEVVYKLVYTGSNMACLVDIRTIFYDGNGVKHIPIDYLIQHFNDVSLYCLFMDDGSYDISSNSYIINTQCFSEEELKQFVVLLYNKFNLEFSIKTDHCLYLKHVSNSLFQKLLERINECPDMIYKLGKSSENSVKQGNSQEDNPVLNPQEIEEDAKRLEVMPNERDEAIKSSTKAGHYSK